MQNLLLIFANFFKIALFVVGGGFAMIPVIEDTFVKQKKILSEEDMLDMIAVTQTLPGMTAVNAAIFVGHKIAGLKGALAAVFGVILPSLVIVMILATLFKTSDITDPHWLKAFSCVRACVTAIFCMMAYRIAKRVLKTPKDFIFSTVFIMLLFAGIPPICVILCSIPVGWLLVLGAKNSSVKELK